MFAEPEPAEPKPAGLQPLHGPGSDRGETFLRLAKFQADTMRGEVEAIVILI